MVSKKQENGAAILAFVEQPASTRALAIPEILELVLGHIYESDWRALQAVNTTWRTLVDTYIMSVLDDLGDICMRARSIGLPGADWRSYEYDLAGVLQRNVHLADEVETLVLNSQLPFPTEYMATLESFRNLRALHAYDAPTPFNQILLWHEHSPFAFQRLYYANVPCRQERIAALQKFLSSLPSLRILDLYWPSWKYVYWTSDQETQAQEEFASLLSSLPKLRELEITLPDHFRMPKLASVLPNGLQTFILTGGWISWSSVLPSLQDREAFPHLSTIRNYT